MTRTGCTGTDILPRSRAILRSLSMRLRSCAPPRAECTWRVAAIRGLGYEPASGIADVLIDRLDTAALEQILALGRGAVQD